MQSIAVDDIATAIKVLNQNSVKYEFVVSETKEKVAEAIELLYQALNLSGYSINRNYQAVKFELELIVREIASGFKFDRPKNEELYERIHWAKQFFELNAHEAITIKERVSELYDSMLKMKSTT